MPALLRWTCGDYARVPLHIRTRGCGCIEHPAFPAPSVFLGEWFLQKLGRIAPRDCGVVFGVDVIARSEATKQSIVTIVPAVDCFASLAMTVSRRAIVSVVIARHRVGATRRPM